MGQPIRRNYVRRVVGDARHTSADITKAQNILAYVPQASLKEGLTREWQWIKSCETNE